MIKRLHVLSIGSPDSNKAVRDALLLRGQCRLTSAASVMDLSAFLAVEKIEVAILNCTLSATELRSCANYIRHHLPTASILLVHAKSEILDDPMYDERIAPDSSQGVLLAAIEQLAVAAWTRTAACRKGHAEWQVR